jgi:hypothetical protein
LVDRQSDYRLGQYLYVTDANPANNQHMTWYRGKLDLQIHPSRNGKILSVIRTPYGWEAQMESTATNTPSIATSIRLFEHEKKIEFVEEIEKDKVVDKEAVYFAFPFAVNHPQFQYELQTTSMDPTKDMYPGAGHEWFSVQHWISVQADGFSASVLPLDVPLVTLGDIDRGQWLNTFGERRATIFSFAMNNYWEDNYVGSQGGNFQFHYVVTSAPSTNEGQLSRLGWEEVTPLESDEITFMDKALNRPHPLDSLQASFAQIQDPNLLLDTAALSSHPPSGLSIDRRMANRCRRTKPESTGCQRWPRVQRYDSSSRDCNCAHRNGRNRICRFANSLRARYGIHHRGINAALAV